MTRLYCETSKEYIELYNEIKNSGEGIIYKTSKTGFLAKIYHAITEEQVKKLKVMIANSPIDPTLQQGHTSIAWPKDLLQDLKKRYVGFLMPEIKNGKTLTEVYNPSCRQKQAPGFNWRYLHITALNIAYISSAIHRTGHVICDIKPQNLLVNEQGLVSIIDTDSFQISERNTGKKYRSDMGSAEFTPPEMFNIDFKAVNRSEYQDRFGLAVIIWLLLFGYHPFSGKWKGVDGQPDIDELISKGYWIYGKNSQLHPAPHMMPLNIVHPAVIKCFRKCFDDGYHNPSCRPSASEWETALRSAINELVQCSAVKEHWYASSFGSCYWCKRKKQLNYDIFEEIPGSTTQPVITQSTPTPMTGRSITQILRWVVIGIVFLRLIHYFGVF